MIKHPGTHEGDKQEVEFVKYFNLNKVKYKDHIEHFEVPLDCVWLIRVTTKQLSSLSNKVVFTRSDAYLIKSSDNKINDLININNGYVDEDILSQEKIDFDYLSYSGISIKLSTSSKFQILKLGPASFQKLFGSYELGAGASIFCMRDLELEKNKELILGWNTTSENMNEYFKFLIKENVNFEVDKLACEKVKKYSLKKIAELIEKSTELQEKIFNGKTLYEEPYTAWYFSKGLNIETLKYLPFTVTTGSGRSKGDYTIVLKPV